MSNATDSEQTMHVSTAAKFQPFAPANSTSHSTSHSPMLILPAILPAIRPCQCRDMVTLGPLPFLGQE